MPTHQRGHGGGVGLGEVEVGTGQTGSIDEQRHRRVGRQHCERPASVLGGGQRGQRQDLLAINAERATRGRQHVQQRQALEQQRDKLRGGARRLLAVVEHDQGAPPRQRRAPGLRPGLAAQALGQRRGDALGAVRGSQGNEHGQVEGRRRERGHTA
jgi:hypothetical protein